MSKIENKTLSALLRLIIKIIIILIVFYILFTFVFGLHINYGNNMYPAVRDGDLCLTYKLDTYNPGDVVTYKIDETRYFSRIIAINSGEVIISPEGFKLNGYVPTEEIFYPTTSPTEQTFNLKNGELFVLNDFRSDDNDSRKFNLISVDDIDGKIIFILRRRGF